MSTRKRHSAKKHAAAQAAGPNPFKVRDCIKVKAGIKDPDFDVEIGGWQGYVISIEGALVDIGWDSITLRDIPGDLIDRCEEDGLGWTEMRLSSDELELAVARDTPEAVKQTQNQIHKAHAWTWLGPEGRQIQQVLKDTDPENEMEQFEAWQAHLTKRLTFPLEAVVSEFQEHGPLQSGDPVKVTGLNDLVEELYGLIADVRVGHRKYALPLCDLEAADEQSPAHDLLQEYAVWFANR
jgi:hypothetical protein